MYYRDEETNQLYRDNINLNLKLGTYRLPAELAALAAQAATTPLVSPQDLQQILELKPQNTHTLYDKAVEELVFYHQISPEKKLFSPLTPIKFGFFDGGSDPQPETLDSDLFNYAFDDSMDFEDELNPSTPEDDFWACDYTANPSTPDYAGYNSSTDNLPNPEGEFFKTPNTSTDSIEPVTLAHTVILRYKHCLLEPEQLECHHCPHIFGNLKELLLHYDEHDLLKNMKYKCPCKDCPFMLVGFNKKPMLRRHVIASHVDSCTNDIISDDKHLTQLIEQLLFFCTKCQKPFSRRDSLIRHNKLKHCPRPKAAAPRKRGRAKKQKKA